MKHQNITFSIPEDLKATLHAHIGKRGVSQFISGAIRNALKAETLKKENELDAAYEASNRDVDRLEVIQDWDKFDEVSDLIDDSENWSWLGALPSKRKKLKHD